MVAGRGRRLGIHSACAAGFAATLLCCAALFPYRTYSSATQDHANPSAQVPVFRSNPRMVLIDVVVTDKNGNPIHGLQPQEFALKDEGTRQTLLAAEEHRQETHNEVKPPFALGPEVRTNWVSSPSAGAASIIVFDNLNSLAGDRAYGRQELVQLLKNLPPGQQVALFTLNARLRMVQDFTSDSGILLGAAEKMSTGSGPLSAVELDETLDQLMQARSQAAAAESQARSGSAAASGGSPVAAGSPAGLSARTGGSAKDQYVIMMDTRVAYTLDAFRDLAKATASLPGRKNVIWLTAGFPVKVDGTMLIGQRVSWVLQDRDYSQNIRSAVAALASAQIAIYPVDMTGIVGPVKLKLGFLGSDWSQRTSLEEFDERATLQTIAEETGGHAYYDRNDLDSGIRQVLTNGSNYYTLAYSPRNIKWDGSYHRVSVKLARKGLQLAYRRGYHALADSPLTAEQASRSLGAALGLDAMDSRMIVLAADFVQPGAQGQPLVIKCSIDPNTLALQEAADGTRSATVAIAATAWDAQRHRVGEAANKVEIRLTPNQFATAKAAGIPWTMRMTLQPGTYRVKLAVVDLQSGKTGSLSVPLKLQVTPPAAGG